MKVFAIIALSADGCVAVDNTSPTTNWTTKYDAGYFQRKTKEADALVMGFNTFKTFNKPGRAAG